MRECSKAMRRRLGEVYLDPARTISWKQDIFKGVGLDVGAGDDGLSNWCSNCLDFDLADGSGDDLRKFFPATVRFDFIAATHVLEHASDPAVMLNSWISLLKPGGHVILEVPDFVRYEKQTFPSKFNRGHKSIWSMEGDVAVTWRHPILGERSFTEPPIECLLPNWFERFNGIKVVRCELIDSNYDYTASSEVDQTFCYEDLVECCLEAVIQKL